MALRLVDTIDALNKHSKERINAVKNQSKEDKPEIPPLSTEPTLNRSHSQQNLHSQDEKHSEKVERYARGQIVDKEYTDQMGQREDAKIPEWMQKDAAVPAHIKDLQCEKFTFPKEYYRDGKWCVLIRNVFTKEECNELIKFSEEQGYEEALVNIGYGRQKMIPEFRNCKRMMIDNFDMVNCLWSRVQQFIPTYFQQRKKVSFNERLRFLRYHKGEYFAPHYDGTYRRENGEISKITFLLYLNDSFKGGGTRFLHPFNEDNYHTPKISTGMVVMFQHDAYHEGAILEEDVKYIVRTDVMYTKKKYQQSQIEKEKGNVEIGYVAYDGWNVVSEQ